MPERNEMCNPDIRRTPSQGLRCKYQLYRVPIPSKSNKETAKTLLNYQMKDYDGTLIQRCSPST